MQNSTTTFSGGFFDAATDQTDYAAIYLTVKDAAGATLSHRKIFGSVAGVFLFDRAKEAPNQPPPLELLFAKEYGGSAL